MFDQEAKGTTLQVLTRAFADGNPVIDDMMSMWGPMSPAQMVDEIDNLLYAIDTKGAKAAVIEGAAREGYTYGANALFDEFLDGLYRRHQEDFKSIQHILHGNVNRNNMERFLNSPLLYWPLSYQLKAGKWVFDLLTDRFLGAKTDLLGMGYLNYAIQRHDQLMESNKTYQGIFMNHPQLWQTMTMMLPMTPFDMGVFMARWTRYAGSWGGAQLGAWEQNETYPQDIVSFIERSTKLGPLYSLDLMGRILDEASEATRSPAGSTPSGWVLE
jgi:hypothetical protein